MVRWWSCRCGVASRLLLAIRMPLTVSQAPTCKSLDHTKRACIPAHPNSDHPKHSAAGAGVAQVALLACLVVAAAAAPCPHNPARRCNAQHPPAAACMPGRTPAHRARACIAPNQTRNQHTVSSAACRVSHSDATAQPLIRMRMRVCSLFSATQPAACLLLLNSRGWITHACTEHAGSVQ